MSVRRLPVVRTPAEDESLSSYVARMAAIYELPLSDMLAALGLTDTPVGRPKVVGYGTLLAPSRVRAMQQATGLDAEVIESMLLARYDGIAADLSGLDPNDPQSFVQVARRQWMLFRDSRLCPACLTERAGAWRLRWKVPWVFACAEHKCLLLDECPGCAQPHSYGDGDSCLPVYWGHVPEPTRCGNRVPTCPPEAPSREPCGQQLLDLRALPLGNSSILAAQVTFEQALTEGTAVVAGERVGGTEFFQEARSLYSLLLHHGQPGDFPEMPTLVDESTTPLSAFTDTVTRFGQAQRPGSLRSTS